MPHLHTEPGQHDNTVSAYIFQTEEEPKILLHKHRKIGKWLQFGGHIELHENPWQAMEHELVEESGYELDQLDVLQPKDRLDKLTEVILHPSPSVYITHRFDDKHNHTDIAWTFTTTEAPRQKPAETESETIRAFTQDEVIKLPKDSIYDNTREIVLFNFRDILPNWEPVPSRQFPSEYLQ